MFGKQNPKYKIKELLRSLCLNPKEVDTSLLKQEAYLEDIYETLQCLKKKGKANHTEEWIAETMYYSPNADCYSLLLEGNVMTTIKNAALLARYILPTVREMSEFSQQAFDRMMTVAIHNTSEDDQITNPLMVEEVSHKFRT
ncbi:MAG TPA: hypothetical protein VHD33_05405 [Legionellaceae bacterium]|nr:hypothetical protein [Legionellaceae bacterium]